MSQGIMSVKWSEYLKHISKSFAHTFPNLKTWVPLQAEEWGGGEEGNLRRSPPELSTLCAKPYQSLHPAGPWTL